MMGEGGKIIFLKIFNEYFFLLKKFLGIKKNIVARIFLIRPDIGGRATLIQIRKLPPRPAGIH